MTGYPGDELRLMAKIRYGWIAICFLAAVRAAPGQEVEVPELRAELLEMAEADQAARHELVESLQAGGEPDSALVAELMALDARHTARMKQVLVEHGWPGISAVGADGSGAAFLLVQHSDRDPAFQKMALELLEDAWRDGEASGQDFALLTDRVRVHEGRPQLYGTQASIEDGRLVFDPIADSASVDARRAELGLPPLAQYRALLEETYGIARDRVGDEARDTTGPRR